MLGKVRRTNRKIPSFAVIPVIVVGVLSGQCLPAVAGHEVDRGLRDLVTKHCVSCHEGQAAEASLDLAEALEATSRVSGKRMLPADLSDVWVRVEKVVTQRRMPPAEEQPLSEEEHLEFDRWFHERLVLRDGLSHVGPTRLRRLTQEEFLASLEDLLGIRIREGYNHLQSVHVADGFVDRVLPVEVPGESGFTNDADALASQPLPLLEYMKCVDFALAKMSGSSDSLRMLTGSPELPSEISDDQIHDIAKQFLHRALRGKATSKHVERAVACYAKEVKSKTSMVAFKSMLRTILLLPEFHYRFESIRGESNPYQVTDFEFATRLSFFLTGSTPDDQLLKQAADGKIRQSEVLDAEIRRLMSTPRRLSLSESFAGQWVGFDGLLGDDNLGERRLSVAVRAQYDELLYFFDEIFKSNRSVLEIIDSDWVYVSNYTLKSYGADQFTKAPQIESLHENILQSRALTGQARRGIERIYDPPSIRGIQSDRYGGIITSAAVMSLTSAPQRTSPVRRGVWVLDRILGHKLEAPANVPPIEQAIRSLPSKKPGKLEIIRAHTSMSGCKVCHQDIDPVGFGLENFDPVGKWRTVYPDKTAIQSRGMLPSGKSFASPKELKQLLLTDDRERVVRNFIRRMMSYAYGRSLRPHDRITEDNIFQDVVKHDYRSNSVIRAIIESPQFNCRQDEES